MAKLAASQFDRSDKVTQVISDAGNVEKNLIKVSASGEPMGGSFSSPTNRDKRSHKDFTSDLVSDADQAYVDPFGLDHTPKAKKFRSKVKSNSVAGSPLKPRDPVDQEIPSSPPVIPSKRGPPADQDDGKF
jgi:hypothetical protein